jgi:transposase
VIDLLQFVDTKAFRNRYANSGPGRPAYHPDMMLALVIYAYCNGVRSSRQIQRLCSTDIAYRVLCAGQIPDHATIAHFRSAQQEALKNIFVGILRHPTSAAPA